MLVDTHCHIHESNYPLDREAVYARARAADVTMICVGTSQASSREAVAFAAAHEGTYAAIGVHPHEAKDGWREVVTLAGQLASPWRSAHGYAGDILSNEQRSGEHTSDKQGGKQEKSKLVAIGEIGLDYFYTHSPRDVQIAALEAQLDLALKYNLPAIFHVRDAFADFWPLLDNFHGLRGVLHSFTDTQATLEQALQRGLYIGVNGISTFTKDSAQHAMFATIPLEKLLLETDAPFLTPVPLRGTINEPMYVGYVAQFHAAARGLSVSEVAAVTTTNARTLFALS